MECPDRKTVSQLDALANIGKAIMAVLQRVGIHHPQELRDGAIINLPIITQDFCF